MNTTTDSHRIDEARDAYVEWLELSIAVQDAYVRWRHGPRREAAVSFAAYTSALDLEERSALETPSSSPDRHDECSARRQFVAGQRGVRSRRCIHRSPAWSVRPLMREPDAGRYVHIRPRRLPPEWLDRVEALADKHGIDRDFARRLAAELHHYEEAA
jgi:hypothetical protein